MAGPRDDRLDTGLALYEALVDMANPPTRHGLEQLGFGGPIVDAELERLAAAGMIRLLPGGAVDVTPPELALPLHAAHLERMAARSRSSVGELAARFRHAREQGEQSATFDVRVLADLTEFKRARRQILRGAQDRILVVATRTPSNDRWLHELPREVKPQRSPALTRRLVLDTSILDVTGSREVIDALVTAGVQVRLRAGLALGILVVDRSVAIVDITNHDASGYGSLVVRHPPLVEGLAQLADSTFATSAPVPAACGRARRRYGEREVRVLALLAAGASDATISRQLGISQRTVERHVRRILDDLNATTRFQAGVRAERDGLL